MSGEPVMHGSYNYLLVAVSVLISIAGAYAALDLAGRITDTRGRARAGWLIGGAAASGINTWAMHYTAMAAFSLPVPVWYDWPAVLLSFAPASCAAAIALFFVSRTPMGWLQTVAGSVFMGGGIAALHYTAMTSMRFQGMCRYSPAMVTLSVLYAALLSFIPLRLLCLFRTKATGKWFWKASSVLLMGLANPAMHYTGMAATTFTRSAVHPDLSHATSITLIGALGIAAIAFLVPFAATLTTLVDQLKKHQALLDELFEQAPQVAVLLDPGDRIVRANREFTHVFGYEPEEALGRRLSDLILPDELQEEERNYRDLAARGELVDAEVVRRGKDGSRVEVSILRVPISMPGGQTAAYAIYRDITDRKRMENELLFSFEQLRALAARLQTVREDERTRVAREIHDGLGQALTAIRIEISALIRSLPADRQQLERTQSIFQLVDETIESVRRISTELRPQILDDLGLVAAIEWAAEEFEARTGAKCRLDLPLDDLVVDPTLATAIFRIFQESLTNIARHATATEVGVRLARENGGLILEVHDNGKGLPTDAISGTTSLGILGMQERAALLGGELSVTSRPGKGTTVKVRIPETDRGKAAQAGS